MYNQDFNINCIKPGKESYLDIISVALTLLWNHIHTNRKIVFYSVIIITFKLYSTSTVGDTEGTILMQGNLCTSKNLNLILFTDPIHLDL